MCCPYLALLAAALVLLPHLPFERLARLRVPLQPPPEFEPRDVAALRRAQYALRVLPIHRINKVSNATNSEQCNKVLQHSRAEQHPSDAGDLGGHGAAPSLRRRPSGGGEEGPLQHGSTEGGGGSHG